MTMVKSSNLFDPEVIGGLIEAKIEAKDKLINYVVRDESLLGVPGSTVTFIKETGLTPAEKLTEGVAMDTESWTQSEVTYKVGEYGKAVEITNTALLTNLELSGHLDKKANQLAQAIVSARDNEFHAELAKADTLTLDASSAIISYNSIVDARGKFQEEDDELAYLVIHPDQETQLRKDPMFVDKAQYGRDVMGDGAIGMIAGLTVIKSKKIKDDGEKYTNFIFKVGAVSEFPKTGVQVKVDEDILKRTVVLAATQHTVLALTDESKVVKFTTKKQA